MRLITYKDFVQRVDELGFLPLSNLLPGMPSLVNETPDGSWHSGDDEHDPWCWKDRAATEKALAYGCILGGHRGFVSARMYRFFYAAYQPEEWMEERWESGLISQTTWQLWQLFERQAPLSTGEVRQAMGVTAKHGGSRVDASLLELQRDFHITVAGNKRKVDRQGNEYGWPASVFDTVTSWAPPSWLEGASDLTPEQAREAILDAGMAVGKDVSRDQLSKALRLR